MRVILSCVVTCMILLSGCGGSGGGSGSSTNTPVSESPVDPSTLTYANYYDTTNKFKASYPTSVEWMKFPQQDDPEVIMEIDKLSGDGSGEATIVLVKTTGDVKQAATDLVSYSVASSRQVSFAHTAATEEVLDATINDGGTNYNTKLMITSTLINGSGYGLIYLADSNKFEKYLEVARYIATTLDIGHAIFSNFSINSDLGSPGKPAIANDGSNMLVVTCKPESRDPNIAISIVARLVSQDRTLGPEITVYTGQFADSNENCDALSAGVAFDGHNYLVAYNPDSISNAGVKGVRISSDGSIVDQVPISLSGVGESTFRPKVVFDGTKFLVVWYRFGVGQKIEGVSVSTDGAVGEMFTVANLDNSTPSPQEPLLALSDNATAVAWFYRTQYFDMGFSTQYQSISFQVLDANSSPQLIQPLTITTVPNTSRYSPSLASDGSNFLVSWIAYEQSSYNMARINPTIYAARISGAGTAIDPTDGGIAVLNPSQGMTPDFLDTSYHDGKYYFAWSDTSYSLTAGAYVVTVNSDLSSSSNPKVVPATADDTYFDSVPTGRQPAIWYQSDRMSVLWPTDGVELWDVWYSELE